MEHLKHVAKILIGYQTRAGIPGNPDGTYKLIKGKDLHRTGDLDCSNLLTFTPDQTPKYGLIEPEDILFQARGIEHFAYCVEKPSPNLVASSTFYIIRADKENVVPQYLTWWINQIPAQQFFESSPQTANISFIKKGFLSELPVPVPDIEIQKLVCKTIMLARDEAALHRDIAERRIQLADTLCLKQISKGIHQ